MCPLSIDRNPHPTAYLSPKDYGLGQLSSAIYTLALAASKLRVPHPATSASVSGDSCDQKPMFWKS